jgi:hypothetical protein
MTMLTEKQIDQAIAELHDGIRSLDIWDALWLMGAQAKQAIDLAAENEQLKAELAEYAETFSEQNKALSDHIIANARLKAKLDDLRNLATEETYGTANMSWSKAMQAVLAIIGKDGDTDA